MPSNYFLFDTKIYCEDTNETCVGYQEYLKSEHWEKLRSKRINKKSTCSICNSGGILHLHHNNYNNLGNEKFTDLLVVCEKCHRLIHKGIIPKGGGKARKLARGKKTKKRVINEINLVTSNVKIDIKKARYNCFDTDCKQCGTSGEITYCYCGYKHCPSKRCAEFIQR